MSTPLGSQQRMSDIFEIQQNLFRYARGVDRRDWDTVRSTYHFDAQDNHGNYKGGVDGFIASLEKRHASIVQSLHLIGNVMIDFAGDDVALVESYFVAYQRLLPQPGVAVSPVLRAQGIADHDTVDNEVVGRYIDIVTRRQGCWRIQKRDVVYDLYRSKVATSDAASNPNLSLSTRNPDDLLYARRRELGL